MGKNRLQNKKMNLNYCVDSYNKTLDDYVKLTG